MSRYKHEQYVDEYYNIQTCQDKSDSIAERRIL